MSKVNYQFMFLTGAVLFSLSALPGIHKTEKVYSTDLLSSGCDLVGQMVKEGTALCGDLKRNNVNAKIIVVKSEKNPEYAEVTTEVECKLGCEDGIRRNTKTVSIKNLENLQKVGDAMVDEATKKMETDNRKAAEVEKKKELCLVNDEEEKFETQAEIVDCRVGKVAAMDDEAKARKYYREHIQKQLEDLIKSRSSKDREMAKESLNKLGSLMSISCRPRSMPTGMNSNFIDMSKLSFKSEKSAISDRGYIEESACDMLAFSAYTDNLEAVKTNLDMAKANGLNPNDPRVLQTMAFAAQQESTWGNYFRQRGLELNAPGMGPSGSMLFGSVERSNSFYTSNYNEIIRAHQGLLNPNASAVAPSANAPQFVNPNDPRFRQQAVQAAQGKVTAPQTQTLPRNAWPAAAQSATAPQSVNRGAVTPVPAAPMQVQSGQFSVPQTVPMTVPMRR